MDGIQPYAGPPRPPSLPANPPPPSTIHKAPSDYLRALRRRVWLVLAIAVPLSVAGAIWIARQPNVYSARTQILIEPPRFDPFLSALITKDVGAPAQESAETYIPNRIAMLRSKTLADQVVNDASLTQGNGAPPEAADDLLGAIQTRRLLGTGQFTVSLDGTDPARITKQLQLLLEAFREQAKAEVRTTIDSAMEWAQTSLKKLEGERVQLDESIQTSLRNSETIGPGGRNLKQTQYDTLNAMILQKHAQLAELRQQAFLSQSMPNARATAPTSNREIRLAEFDELREKYQDQLAEVKRRVRYFNSDPTAIAVGRKLKTVLDKMDRLRAVPTASQIGFDPYEALADAKQADLKNDEDALKVLLAQIQETMPEHQKFLDLREALTKKQDRIAMMTMKIWEFEMVSKSRKDPVSILAPVAEPTVPIRPKRAMNLAIAIVLSFGLGIGLVCLLEHVDHTVKMPEQLTAGLTLPLFGVVPRMRRTASLHRGGHLYTLGSPDSIESDAYRNLRASLLGVSDRRGPIVTLLVTSAKAGEGKSTTALNLAATCARAGERTLLMDVDLRRPSLAGVFQEDHEDPIGLVDVLRGELPWQRTVVRTDLANLDFLPTGDTRGVPIEVLGTLELRQLLVGLSSHYDRVILDGPAILGLADCRMLGRVVDSALLVVRSGSQGLRPLQHAKAMLEQSHVEIAGVVFNGLYEDLKNWSSYGPAIPYGSGDGWSSSQRAGLGAPAHDASLMPLASASPN